MTAQGLLIRRLQSFGRSLYLSGLLASLSDRVPNDSTFPSARSCLRLLEQMRETVEVELPAPSYCHAKAFALRPRVDRVFRFTEPERQPRMS